MILLASEGVPNNAIAQRTGLSRLTVIAFVRNGLEAMRRRQKRKHPGRLLTPELAQKILDTTEKVRDVVGLYVGPPDRALVLCVDEKSHIQALDRTAPILPLPPGLPNRQRMITNGTGLPRCLPASTS